MDWRRPSATKALDFFFVLFSWSGHGSAVLTHACSLHYWLCRCNSGWIKCVFVLQNKEEKTLHFSLVSLVFFWGLFLTSVVNFLIILVVFFCIRGEKNSWYLCVWDGHVAKGLLNFSLSPLFVFPFCQCRPQPLFDWSPNQEWGPVSTVTMLLLLLLNGDYHNYQFL